MLTNGLAILGGAFVAIIVIMSLIVIVAGVIVDGCDDARDHDRQTLSEAGGLVAHTHSATALEERHHVR